MFFAKSRIITGDRTLEMADIVFYFGEIDMDSFFRLREALLTFEMITENNQLYLYLYERNDEFRKIKPDVERLFNFQGPKLFTIRSMERFGDIPSWMKIQ